MPQCKHYKVCHLDANPGEDLCILHSGHPNDYKAFDKALADHREKHGNNFRHFVFPGLTDFSGAIFDTEADFSHATFTLSANFSKAIFTKRANFMYAEFDEPSAANFTDVQFNEETDFANSKFHNEARFSCVSFDGQADFSYVTFDRQADFFGSIFAGETGFYNTTFGEADFCKSTFCRARFSGARFKKEVHFFCATFNAQADFYEANFAKGANFFNARFAKDKEVIFRRAEFLDRMLFASAEEEEQIVPTFSGVKVDFRDVIIAPLDALIFRNADLQKCSFLDTDLRKAEFANVKWPEKRGRLRVYDEHVELQKGETRQWAHIEQLYRQLKQNYEDRRDYGQAGDFHYGEKEMRRRNPETPRWMSCLLRLYRCVGGYGERCRPPLAWAGGLLVVCALLYLCLGLRPKEVSSTSALISVWDYFDYSLRVMTLLKPDDLVPMGCARYVSTVQSLVGPVLIGLFALALRQRLKR